MAMAARPGKVCTSTDATAGVCEVSTSGGGAGGQGGSDVAPGDTSGCSCSATSPTTRRLASLLAAGWHDRRDALPQRPRELTSALNE
jgi:hypothetical protein